MSGMAEVLADHFPNCDLDPDSHGDVRVSALWCNAHHCTFDVSRSKAGSYGGMFAVFATHQAEALTDAGFGGVAEAKAQALEEAVDELARLPYVRPDHPDRAEYERILAVRRGDTDKWLKARAKTLRGEG